MASLKTNEKDEVLLAPIRAFLGCETPKVEVDFSDVDPNLLKDFDKTENQTNITLQDSSISNKSNVSDQTQKEKSDNSIDSKSTIAGKASRFFRKKNN